MRLHEEYILRHKLDIPVIRFDNRSNLFMKTKTGPPKWNVFTVTWRPQQGKPGFYEFVELEPVHNAGLFKQNTKEKYIYWEQYETEILNSIANYKELGYCPVPNLFRGLVAWEMFLYMYDKWLAYRMSTKFYEHVGKSIDQSLDFGIRINACREASRMISNCDDSEKVVETLNLQIMPMANGHSQWLENLING